VTIQLLIIAALVLVNGFFVAAEFALISARETRLGETRLARLVARQREHLDEYLSACQQGITIASLALGALGEPTIAHLLEPTTESAFKAHTAATLATVLALLIMTALHITAGEQAPKSFAIGSAERVAMLCAGPLHVFYLVMRPLVLVLNKVSNGMVRLLGGTPASSHASQASLEELRQIIGSVAEHESLDRTERQMLDGLFTLDERTAADVMTPRHRVCSISPVQTVTEALETTRESGHSRFPVIDDEGNVSGIVMVRELMNAHMDGEGNRAVSSLARDILVAPRAQPLDVVLSRLQKERTSMCAVLDEYGQIDGVVTVEDVIEEVVGEIWDEDDLPTTIEQVDGGALLVEGDLSLTDLISQDIDLTDMAGNFDSVGGLIQNLLGAIAQAGDSVCAGEWNLQVVEVDGHRVSQVRIERCETQAEPAQ
jgi:CBS domain containing-hemolysin-like protein